MIPRPVDTSTEVLTGHREKGNVDREVSVIGGK